MANPSRPFPSLQGMSVPARSGLGRVTPRRLLVAGVVTLALLVLAWFEGGEEPLRAIAEPVALPEEAR